MASWLWIIALFFLVWASISQIGPSSAEKITAAAHGDDDEYGKSLTKRLPLVISTWAFVEAARAAWKVVDEGGSSLDAVVEGCSTCEKLRCDLSVGYGGSPDEAGETTLDAMIMDGGTKEGRKSIPFDAEMFLTQSLQSSSPSNLALPPQHLQQDERNVRFLSSDYTVNPITNPATTQGFGDGQTTMEVGAVGALRSVKDAIKVARLVLDHSEHTLLVGDQASAFAMSLGIPGPSNLSTEDSLQQWSEWRDDFCQPNFRKNVLPDSRVSCGPYRVPSDDAHIQVKADYIHMSRGCSDTDPEAVTRNCGGIRVSDHDTISMAVIDRGRKIAVGTSTNGASHKIPGRVGDGPIAGAAAYADDDVGACGATGDGDIMMRFVPCYQVVESMRRGKSPRIAARDAMERIKRKYPRFVGAVFAVNRHGKHAGACHGWTFQYAVKGNDTEDVEIHTVSPL